MARLGVPVGGRVRSLAILSILQETSTVIIANLQVLACPQSFLPAAKIQRQARSASIMPTAARALRLTMIRCPRSNLEEAIRIGPLLFLSKT